MLNKVFDWCHCNICEIATQVLKHIAEEIAWVQGVMALRKPCWNKHVSERDFVLIYTNRSFKIPTSLKF